MCKLCVISHGPMGGERATGRISIPDHDRRALTDNAHDNGYQLLGDDLGKDLDDDAQHDPGDVAHVVSSSLLGEGRSVPSQLGMGVTEDRGAPDYACRGPEQRVTLWRGLG